jgi:hypothetical protein
VDRANVWWMARVFALPMKSAIFSGEPPSLTAASSASASSCYSPANPAMPGCSTLPSTSPFAWRAMGTPPEADQ